VRRALEVSAVECGAMVSNLWHSGREEMRDEGRKSMRSDEWQRGTIGRKEALRSSETRQPCVALGQASHGPKLHFKATALAGLTQGP